MVTQPVTSRQLGRSAHASEGADVRTRDIQIQTDRRREDWENLPSIAGAQARSNDRIGMAEIRFENQFVDVTGLASVKDWSERHSLSIIDEDRLIDLDLQARRRSMNQTAGKAREAAGEREVDVLDDLVMTAIERDHDHAAAEEESIRERVNFMDQANARGQETGVVQRIGEALPKADWLEAINLLKAKAPGEHGRVYAPKEGGEYGGQVLLVTETHIVQRVGRGTAVAHDLRKLSNGAELAADFDAGKLRPG